MRTEITSNKSEDKVYSYDEIFQHPKTFFVGIPDNSCRLFILDLHTFLVFAKGVGHETGIWIKSRGDSHDHAWASKTFHKMAPAESLVLGN